MYLLDVGVWLSAVWARHVHHPPVKAWFDQQSQPLVLCRVTQMSLLRLLSIPAVLGTDAISRSAAWEVVDSLQADKRVTWADEPPHLEAIWRTMSARDDNSHKLWTDDYLAAFAQASQLTLATLDGALAKRHPSARVQALV
ncbi:TA system VapC family ribonuclease toxin [Phytoactinopolyspora mesophila]|uniref:Ribonuclease VapC n=1 Tax=Phytoactinopolyspora mesophila TaxID=2650750 RepID=A0A7K3LZH6_9ACTN|nr:TA system VapC family ribonuclease toxin [Phytoactinopolyspora mesophila]NDL56424.1 VapC toxin family PIN domain ribonuclease [Phytoactinopolyspora mesophila]